MCTFMGVPAQNATTIFLWMVKSFNYIEIIKYNAIVVWRWQKESHIFSSSSVGDV